MKIRTEQLLYFFILFYDLLPELTAILFVFSHILEEGIVVGVDNLHPDWYDLFRNCSIVQDLERFVEVRLSRVNCRDLGTGRRRGSSTRLADSFNIELKASSEILSGVQVVRGQQAGQELTWRKN